TIDIFFLLFKMNANEFINKLQNTLNKLINEGDLCVKTTEPSNELLETLKIIGNCTNCKYKGMYAYAIEYHLVELEKEEQVWKKEIIYRLNDELNKMDFKLNKEILCEGCREKN